MGRRASIVGSISKIVHNVGVYERKKERERTVQSAINNGGPKEKAPVYNLISVDFDKETRNTKIEFRQTTEYRTIERYVQQNYVKYPVYSSWKTKYKSITKSIKLTDVNLESLNQNADFLLREFATGIIDRIDDEDFYPSWYIINYLRLNEKENIHNLVSQQERNEHENKREKGIFDKSFLNYSNDLNTILSEKGKVIKQRDHYEMVVSKIQSSKKLIIFKILTIGIYAYLVSSKRLIKFKQKLKVANDLIREMNEFEVEYPKLKEIITNQQKKYDELISLEKRNCDVNIKKIRDKTSMLVNEVVPLTAIVEED